jgi:hypothetical protein
MDLCLNSNRCLALWALISNVCHVLIIADYGMIVKWNAHTIIRSPMFTGT